MPSWLLSKYIHFPLYILWLYFSLADENLKWVFIHLLFKIKPFFFTAFWYLRLLQFSILRSKSHVLIEKQLHFGCNITSSYIAIVRLRCLWVNDLIFVSQAVSVSRGKSQPSVLWQIPLVESSLSKLLQFQYNLLTYSYFVLNQFLQERELFLIHQLSRQHK